MLPMSDAFKETVRRSHTMVTRCEVLASNFTIIQTLDITQGNVSASEEDAINRSCTASLVDPTGDLTPKDAADLIHPKSGNMLRMFRGVKLPNGEKEYKAQGIFNIEDADIQDPGEHVRIDLRGFNFAKRVESNPFQEPFVIPAGTRYDMAIRELINNRAPGSSFNFDEVTFVTPQITLDVGDDPMSKAMEMAESIGHRLWVDVQGFWRLAPVVDLSSAEPVWTYEEGEFAQLLYVNKRLSIEGFYNQVYARSNSSQLEEQVVGIAQITEGPNSINGPLGARPTSIESEYIRSQEQADELAQARLRQTVGSRQGMNIIITVNPAHEEGDVIRVKRPRIHVDEKYVIRSLNINLDPWQGMNITMREVMS